VEEGPAGKAARVAGLALNRYRPLASTSTRGGRRSRSNRSKPSFRFRQNAHELLSGDVKRIRIADVEVDAAHLPHPGIVMRKTKDCDGTSNPWPAPNKQFVAKLAEWLWARRE
jgi:hypothetical protein